MHFDILSIFPKFFESYFQSSLQEKAVQKGVTSFALHDIRNFATDRHKTVDDVPFGGGAGMVFKPEPLVKAILSVPRRKKSLRILLSPRGKLLDQKFARDLATYEQLVLVCPRYEGVDERVSELAIDQEISVGDYVLNSGEVAALVLIDVVSRLLSGFIGNETSLKEESFFEGLLEYPQYTRPREFQGLKVPEVLLSGDHSKIEKWRRSEALAITAQRRPDLLEKGNLKQLPKEKKRARKGRHESC